MKYLKELQVKYTPSKKLYQGERITNSELAFQYVSDTFNHETIACQEQFNVLFMNNAHLPIGYYKASVGSNTATVVDIKLLFSVILKCNASAIIISHNHPSGNLKPSLADEKITSRIKECANLLDITLLDHLIITKDGYYSFSNEKFI